MSAQKGISLLITLVAISTITVIGVGGFLVLGNNNETSTDSETSEQHNDDHDHNENEEKNSENSNNSSISSITSGGKSLECSFSYSGENGEGQADMYTDGNGNARIDMALSTERGNNGNITQIIKGDKSYSLVKSGDKTIAFEFKLNEINSETSNSSNQGLSPDANFNMTCDDWQVDTSKFEIPTSAQFLKLPSSLSN